MYDHSHPMNAHHHHTLDDEPNSVSAAANHAAYDDVSAAGVIVDGIDSSIYITEQDLVIPSNDVDISTQLTLTFRGQVFVFDTVSPDKVQAVFLLLGGYELPSAADRGEVAKQIQKGAMEYPGRSSTIERAASLKRFRQKRKERCFDKKVRYGVRQEVALRMQRNKGQFTSSKKPDKWIEEDRKETSCTHCGINSKCTPMMRRGPSGPRSLCNACGLFWANKGTLRDIFKKNPDQSSTPIEQGEAEVNGSDCEAATHEDIKLIGDSNGDDADFIAENGTSGLSQ